MLDSQQDSQQWLAPLNITSFMYKEQNSVGSRMGLHRNGFVQLYLCLELFLGSCFPTRDRYRGSSSLCSPHKILSTTVEVLMRHGYILRGFTWISSQFMISNVALSFFPRTRSTQHQIETCHIIRLQLPVSASCVYTLETQQWTGILSTLRVYYHTNSFINVEASRLWQHQKSMVLYARQHRHRLLTRAVIQSHEIKIGLRQPLILFVGSASNFDSTVYCLRIWQFITDFSAQVGRISPILTSKSSKDILNSSHISYW